MHDHSDPYSRFLSARKDKVFYLKPYAGNAGDSLIVLGTRALLSDLGIRESMDPGSADVLVMPGGNPAMWPNLHVSLWRDIWREFPEKEFVVGPSGFRGNNSDWSDPVRREGRSVTGIFARDPQSYVELDRAALSSEITIGLSHDPALYLRQSSWIETHREAATEEYTLVSFRDDIEGSKGSTGTVELLRKVLPFRIYNQLSKIEASFSKSRKIKLASRAAGNGSPIVIREASKQTLDLFLETVRRSKEVHTDRLHVSLLAAMLGKKVFAYHAAHDKLLNVYNHSLKEWADVSFIQA
jgi:exopolysaccharide biosynthesis predicted pyruvyltransferase EpsI